MAGTDLQPFRLLKAARQLLSRGQQMRCSSACVICRSSAPVRVCACWCGECVPGCLVHCHWHTLWLIRLSPSLRCSDISRRIRCLPPCACVGAAGARTDACTHSISHVGNIMQLCGLPQKCGFSEQCGLISHLIALCHAWQTGRQTSAATRRQAAFRDMETRGGRSSQQEDRESVSVARTGTHDLCRITSAATCCSPSSQ